VRKIAFLILVLLLFGGCYFFEPTPSEPIEQQVDWEQVIDRAKEEAWDKGCKECSDHVLATYDLMLRKPTYKEVMDFIQEDGTDQMMVANCLTRVERLREEANKRDIWCYVVLFNYFTGSRYGFHAIVAFDTKDKGLIFIEPQTDDVVKCDIGIDYSEEMCKSGKLCPLEKMFIRQIGVIR